MLAVAALFKWQLFKHTEYDAIFFTDVDVDLYPAFGGLPPNLARGTRRGPSRAARELIAAWTRGLLAFVGSGSSLVASADYHSPINTGVMLLRPSERMYQLGLRVLRRNDFDPTLGFDRAGRPSEALAALRAHATPQLWREVAATRMLWQDRWTFVGGHACQGLFVHVFLVLPWAGATGTGRSGKAHAANTDADADAASQAGPHEATLRFHFPRNISERREDGLGTHHVHHFRAQGKV